ncbi:MAG: hypothetical protein ACE5PO_06270 [Candidatus Bathyarchaeia archaeon]
MATQPAGITADQSVVEVLQKHPEALRVMAKFGVNVCCSCHGTLSDCVTDSRGRIEELITELNRTLKPSSQKAANRGFSLFLFTGYGLGDLLSSRLDSKAGPVHVEEIAEFSPENYVPKLLYASKNLKAILLCFKKHQTIPPHSGRGDVVFKVVKGRATFTMNSATFNIREGHMLMAPAGSTHGITSQGRALLLAFAVAPPANEGAPLNSG